MIYKTALGIEVWDKVTTSYNTGPYRVIDIHGPRYVSRTTLNCCIIRAWPVISLRCRYIGPRRSYGTLGPAGPFLLSDIRQEGEYWFTDQNDQIFVTKPKTRPAMLVDMWQSYPTAEPYEFNPGVDYSVPLRVWKCDLCDLDFNGSSDAPTALVATCPVCDWPGCARPIFVMQPRTVDSRSACQLYLCHGKRSHEPFVFKEARPAAVTDQTGGR